MLSIFETERQERLMWYSPKSYLPPMSVIKAKVKKELLSLVGQYPELGRNPDKFIDKSVEKNKFGISYLEDGR